LPYVETSNASEAYRRSYDVGDDTNPKGIWVNASKLLADPKVAQRVMELQAKAVERTMVTVQTLTQELDEDRAIARKLDMPSAAITAVMGKAKLHGLAADRQLVGGDSNAPPWTRATGPKTVGGKAVVSRNANKGGKRP
jgi:phage terminase small subunit